MNWYIARYVFYLGIFLVCAGLLEFFFSSRAFRFWERWIMHRFFPVHGLFLIVAGMPLTAYNGTFSTFIFVFGVTVVLTGPFILLYPEKIRASFKEAAALEGENFQSYLVRFDAIVRLFCGIVFIVSRFI